MSNEYMAIVKHAAQELECAIRKERASRCAWDRDITLFVKPGIAVAIEQSSLIGYHEVSPSDNGASTYRRWCDVPFSALESVLFHAMKTAPIY